MADQKSNGEVKKIDSIIYGYTTNTNALEDENKLLKETVSKFKEELETFKKIPFLVAEVKDIVEKNAIIRLQNGNEFFVNISSECGEIFPGDSVLMEQKNITIIKKVPVSKVFNVEKFVIIEKPTITWKDV